MAIKFGNTKSLTEAAYEKGPKRLDARQPMRRHKNSKSYFLPSTAHMPGCVL